MLSDLQTQKFTRLFHLYDFMGNDKLTREDFLGLAGRCKLLNDMQGDEPNCQRVERAFQLQWEELSQFADRDADGAVHLTEWLRFVTFILSDDTTAEMYRRNLADAIMGALDVDIDRAITLDEYRSLYHLFEIDASPAAAIFARLDANHSGGITRDDLVRLLFDFCHDSEGHAPGNDLFGPYAESVMRKRD